MKFSFAIPGAATSIINASSVSFTLTAGIVLFVLEKFELFQSIKSLEKKLSIKDGNVGNNLSDTFASFIT
jgi:hypothetical protein